MNNAARTVEARTTRRVRFMRHLLCEGGAHHRASARAKSTEKCVNHMDESARTLESTSMRVVIAMLALALGSCGRGSGGGAAREHGGVDSRRPNGIDQHRAFPEQTRAPERKSNVDATVVTIARGLEHPWALAFLPEGRMLVTERPGRLHILDADGTVWPAVAGLPAVD